MNKCSHCKNKTFYTLSNGYLKCTKCTKKYSLKKIEKDKKILFNFCQNKTALETSIILQVNYVTISKKYKVYRNQIIQYLDENYNEIINTSNEYDEYVYINKKNILKSQNFLTFNYSSYIYNLMLPSLGKFSNYDKNELSKFLQFNKIAKLKSSNSEINDFWKFLEEYLKKYKGIKPENFIYFLKEAEFKFNYSKKTQEEILLELNGY